MIDIIQGNDPFVAFVGAGASAVPPSNLPTWTQFNNMLLECLCERLAEYSRNRQPTDAMISLFRTRRDETHFFTPDFQAQLMEEEVGSDYFRVWQSLETDVYGPVHEGLAELASQGRLAAIITTNFDRLIETALLERGKAFQVFYDKKTFEALEVLGDEKNAVLPVIKIHGSIEDAESLIDTLRQRVVGRPESLMKVLQVLLRKYPWLYLGFSGADFSYDPHYLGILDSAVDAKGFVFLARQGMKVQEGVSRLAQVYGMEKASIIYGDLSHWLSQAFKLSALKSASVDAIATENDIVLRVRNKMQQWTKDLGSMAVVNILQSMLKSSGMETQSLWLLRKTWKSYRMPDDTKGPSYDRYNFNYGMSLLEAGFIRNPISLAEDMNNLIEWQKHADQNAYEFFARSYTSGKLLVAGAQLASVLAYRGEVGKAIALTSTVTDEALARNNKLDLCDVANASVVIYDIVRLFDPAAVQLRHCVEITKLLGDEIRRAMLCAQLGRFLTYGGHFNEADEFLKEAERIGSRLALEPVLLASQAARGRWLSDSGKSDESAVQMLSDVVSAIKALDEEPLFAKVDLLQPESPPTMVKGRHPTICRALLDLNRAARFAGDEKIMNQTLDELDVLATEIFLGYCPHYYLAYAECILAYGAPDQRDLMADLIRRAREIGELSKNPWVAQAADNIEKQIENGK